MGIEKDCFAYNNHRNKCEALDSLYCKKGNCNFYRSNREIDFKEIEKAIKEYKK